MSDVLPMWVIYERPKDHPKYYVVRRWELRAGEREVPTDDVVFCDTLEQARTNIPAGRVRLHRFPNDDAVIAEVWL